MSTRTTTIGGAAPGSAAVRPSEPAARNAGRELSVLLVGDFSAGRKGNHSVAQDLAARFGAAGHRVVTTSARSSRLGRVADMVTSSLRSGRRVDVAVVDVYSGPAFRWAQAVTLVLKGAGVPVILVLRGGSLPRYAAAHPQRVRGLFAAAHTVVALSGYLEEKLAEFGSNLITIPNPFAASAYEFRERIRPDPRLVWLRGFHHIYDPEMAVRVVARLAGAFPDVSLVMVGDDREAGRTEATRRLARELGVAERIEFTGPVPKSDVPAQLQRGDIFLNTPRTDNVPISVLEAMASGLCVVSTDAGGLPYMLSPERDSLLVGSGDDEAMAAQVERLLTEPGLAARISRGGRMSSLRYDWESVLPQWQELLAASARVRR